MNRMQTPRVIVFAAAIMMMCFGIRLTVGLFTQPLMAEMGLSIASISAAFAIGQLSWGFFQPIFGAWTDRGHGFTVLLCGIACIIGGELLTIVADDIWLLTLAQGVLAPAGIAAGSLAPLMSIAGKRLPAAQIPVATGIINSGGSFGQFLFAPLVQFLIQTRGHAASLLALCGCALAALLPAWGLCRQPELAVKGTKTGGENTGRHAAWRTLRRALGNRDYALLNAGFFTCGFHVAFLTTHLPGEVLACGHAASVSATSLSLIGLCNIAGSIGAGILGRHFRMKWILAIVYAARAMMIAMFMLSAKSELDFYLFSAATGFTWLATVPPTMGIAGKLYGQENIGTTFGFSFFIHQIGGFLGAWLGGIAIARLGGLDLVWHIDIGLALLAALVNLPIREPPPVVYAEQAS